MGGHDHKASHGHDHGGHGHGHSKIVHNPVIHHEFHEGHGLHEPFRAPDWKEYKIEDAPLLKEVQDKLAKRGLKDPWLRNQVWRYAPKYGAKTPFQAFSSIAFRGFKYGLLAFIGTYIAETAYTKAFGSSDHHGHGHHGDHGHHDDKHH